MEAKIINPKPPSETDLKILNWMDEGNRIDGAKALGLFGCIGIRDVIYRLRCAGHEIKYEDIHYKKNGKNKSYRQWFTKDYQILEAKEKTDKNKKHFFQPEII